jgi:hypothetical protein
MEPIIQPSCKEYTLRGIRFRVFPTDKIISVNNDRDLPRSEINAAIRYMILEGMIKMGTYQVNVYSHK